MSGGQGPVVQPAPQPNYGGGPVIQPAPEQPAWNPPAQQGNGGGGDKPVTINIYYETKCPFSKGFINDEVKPALSDPTCVFQHVHINWEPYGNVQDAGGALMCQHGDDECFGNKLHLCAKQQLDEEACNHFVTCHIEWLTQTNGEASDRAGYQGCGGNTEALTQCANDPSIFEAFRQVGAETAAAQTQHMPWAIMGNGQPNLQGMLVQGLCQQYGTGALAAYPRPQCCG